ncbi:FKBP-type peptidyl-prolyl cis-trans isomerase [Candidatus Saccharibacteria bacterium]|nr:FKBP-type peptidyl-prolyl cis-trans isomerase [Candidatus Saccharibacteria bacterium]
MAKSTELDNAAKSISPQYYDSLLAYKPSVKSFNEESANTSGLQSEDLKLGDGTEVTDSWKDYYAYYIGYCADESVFDSSFDSYENPTTLKAPISGSQSLIAGWTQGVLGMKVGGVRQITVPGELAYGETREICGGTNKPLRFIIMAVDPGEEVRNLSKELNDIISEYTASAQ